MWNQSFVLLFSLTSVSTGLRPKYRKSFPLQKLGCIQWIMRKEDRKMERAKVVKWRSWTEWNKDKETTKTSQWSHTSPGHFKEARIKVCGSPISSSRFFFLGGGLSPECLSAKPCGKRQFRIHQLQEIDWGSIEEIRYQIDDTLNAQAEMPTALDFHASKQALNKQICAKVNSDLK